MKSQVWIVTDEVNVEPVGELLEDFPETRVTSTAALGALLEATKDLVDVQRMDDVKNLTDPAARMQAKANLKMPRKFLDRVQSFFLPETLDTLVLPGLKSVIENDKTVNFTLVKLIGAVARVLYVTESLNDASSTLVLLGLSAQYLEKHVSAGSSGR